MLRFDATQLDGAGGGQGSDVWQLVDAASLVGRTVTLSAKVNRVAGGENTDTQFRIDVRAFTGSIDGFDDNEPAVPAHIALGTASIISDSDPGTWEPVTTELFVPPAASYLGVLVSAVENVSNETQPPEFDGHYVDDVELLVTRPVSALQPTAALAMVVVLTGATAYSLSKRRTQFRAPKV